MLFGFGFGWVMYVAFLFPLCCCIACVVCVVVWWLVWDVWGVGGGVQYVCLKIPFASCLGLGGWNRCIVFILFFHYVVA